MRDVFTLCVGRWQLTEGSLSAEQKWRYEASHLFAKNLAGLFSPPSDKPFHIASQTHFHPKSQLQLSAVWSSECVETPLSDIGLDLGDAVDLDLMMILVGLIQLGIFCDSVIQN